MQRDRARHGERPAPRRRAGRDRRRPGREGARPSRRSSATGGLYVHADVTKEDEVAAAFGRVVERFGGIDTLFNNAGAAEPLGSDPFDLGIFESVQKLLVHSVVLGMKYAVPAMVARGGGSIVNTASVAGLQAGYGPFAYSVAKGAVVHLSRIAAAALAKDAIRVNAICPGFDPDGDLRPRARRVDRRRGPARTRHQRAGARLPADPHRRVARGHRQRGGLLRERPQPLRHRPVSRGRRRPHRRPARRVGGVGGDRELDPHRPERGAGAAASRGAHVSPAADFLVAIDLAAGKP